MLTRSLPRQFAQYLKTIQHEGFALFVVRMSLPLHLYTCRQFVAEKSNITTAQFLPMLVLRYDTIGRIELIPSIVLSSNNTNCKNDIQLFLQLFDELSVYRDYH